MKKIKISSLKTQSIKRLILITVRALTCLLLTQLILSCGGGKRSSSPPAQGNALLPSAPKLSPPELVSPPSATHPSNASTLNITGTCTPDPGATVYLGGDENQEATCTESGNFSFAVSQTSDGTFNYTLREESLVRHPSDNTLLVWNRSTIKPQPPTITSPSSYPYSSSGSSITLSGGCANGGVVTMAGASEQSMNCDSNNAYSFTVTKSIDGVYIFNISQTDSYGNSSDSIRTSWTRNTVVPSTPTITDPSSNPYTSSDSTRALAGTCSNGSTVTLYKVVGSTNQTLSSVACSAGSFSFDISESVDGTYNYSLVAKSITDVSSAAASFQWIRTSTVPATPVLALPTTSSSFTNGNSLVISGSCDDGNTVFLTGDTSDSTTCASSSFSFNITKNSDATYNFSVYQQHLLLSSGAVSVSWTRDTLSPLAPIITVPGISPYYSSSNNLIISGVCETGTSVTLSGDGSNTVPCVGSSFSFSVNKITDASYSFLVYQTDAAGNFSSNASLQWVLDTNAPSIPTITSPGSLTYISNGNSITISGACENNATVYLTGSSTQNVVCASTAYSFSVTKSTDGVYNFSVYQTDLAGLSSGTRALQWTRDTAAPSAPTILNPTSNPLTSNDTNLTISGGCETGSTINYSGASTGSASCTSSAYSFVLSKSVDATYNLSITQTDTANNTSAATSFQWTRLSSIPSTPVISSPGSSPYYGKVANITLSGSCNSGNTVQLAGASTQSIACSSNSFSFSLSQTTDGSYNYSVTQINGSSISSGAATFNWVLDRVSPTAPSITSPSSNPVHNKASSLTVSGSCEANATVNYSGAATGSTTCSVGGSYSFVVNKSTDGVYLFSISQSDQAGNASAVSSLTWDRDTLAPAAPSLSQPSSNPFTSGDSSLTIAGGCEQNATVTLSGASSQSTTCNSFGNYSFSVSNSNDGNYNYSLTQTDLAGNTSGTLSFQWTRDTTIPFTPVIQSPASTSYTSNGSSISVSVTCQTGLTPELGIVHLTGVLASAVISPSNTLDQTCTSSPVTFIIQETSDGVYNFNFNQENPNNGLTSADATLVWTRDTVVPSAPTITTPSSSPYTGPGNLTLAGACESNATVNLTGDSTQSQVCASGAYSFSIVKSTDATYSFSITQSDPAGNTSSASTQSWTRNSSSLPPPTISSPTSPYLSNESSITIAGTCQANYTVTLGGNVMASDVSSPANSLTQTCTSGGAYSFIISKSIDGSFTFSLTESYADATSAAVALVWNRDTAAPTATINTNPSNPNLTSSATFTFSNVAGESATYQCKLGTGSYQSCTSPKTYTGLTNGANTFYIIATDTAGNIGSEVSYSWTQAAYNTVALYHMAAGTGSALNDSGFYTSTAAFNNNLTSFGTPSTNTSGKLPTSSPTSFTLGTSKYFSLSNNSSLNTVNKQMTFEGLYYFSSLTSTAGNYYTLVSKSGSSGNYGWELRLEKSSGTCTKYLLKFVGSLDGTTQTTVPSTSCISVSTGRWYYVVVKWDAGTVNFYMSSSSATSRGSGVIGTAGSSQLFTSTGSLMIGANSSSGTGSSLWITGSVDEVRISNILRTPSYPSTEYNAD